MNTRITHFITVTFSLFILVFVGCAVEPGDAFDADGEFTGTVSESMTYALETAGDEIDREGEYCHNCSTLCECGRIYHPGGWTINCEYWCAKASDDTKSTCDGANSSDEPRPNARRARKKHRVIRALNQHIERTRIEQGAFEMVEPTEGSTDKCYSICGDLGDGNICGPHACTPEAAGSCCPTDENAQRRSDVRHDSSDSEEDGSSEAVYRIPASAR